MTDDQDLESHLAVFTALKVDFGWESWRVSVFRSVVFADFCCLLAHFLVGNEFSGSVSALSWSAEPVFYEVGDGQSRLARQLRLCLPRVPGFDFGPWHLRMQTLESSSPGALPPVRDGNRLLVPVCSPSPAPADAGEVSQHVG